MEVNDKICQNCNSENSIINYDESGKVICSNCRKIYKREIIFDECDKGTSQIENNCSGEIKIKEDNQTKPKKTKEEKDLGNYQPIKKKEKHKNIMGKGIPENNKTQKNCIKIQSFLSSVNVSQNIIDEVKILYNKINGNLNLQKKKITNIVIVAMYYYVCRALKLTKTIKEIIAMFEGLLPKINERIIKRTFNSLKFGISEEKDENDLAEKNYIDTFLEGNSNENELKKLAFQIIENVYKNSLLEGKNPKTIGGIALLLSYKLLNVNLDDKNEFYSKFSNKTALNKSYEEIKDSLDKIIPQEYNSVTINDIFS